MTDADAHPAPAPRTGPLTLFAIFLRLGLTSFGGPLAHLGYFRAAFVERRRWLDEAAYASLVATANLLPGPSSSQVGFALGLRRGGALGGLAAWLGFTLPSALLMAAAGLALAGGVVPPEGAARGALAGLALVAVAVVAEAIRGMARSLTPDATRASVAVAAAALALLVPGFMGQVLALAVGLVAGLALRLPAAGPDASPAAPAASRGLASGLVLVALGVAVVPAAAALVALGPPADVAGPAARAGALVFGGGHVVLPLAKVGFGLEGPLTNPVPPADLEALYGLAQAMPGPLFMLAAGLGAHAGGVAGAAVATVAIFLPGLLMMAGAVRLSGLAGRLGPARRALAGLNAAVVGLLAAALWELLAGAVARGPAAGAIALTLWLLHAVWRFPPLAVAGVGATAGAAVL